MRNAAKLVLRQFSNRYPTCKLACSDYAGKWLFGSEAEFTVIPNGIDISRFSYNHEERTKTRLALGISEETIVVGHVGRFMPQKNHSFLLDMFGELLQITPHVLLIMAGEGELLRAIQRKAEALNIADRVVFLGQQKEIWKLYQAFDVFALPSLYEGLPVSAVEAQAAGLPCVLSDAITEEAAFSPMCEMLPLAAGPVVWASRILELGQSAHDRRVVPHNLSVSYGIESVTQRLSTVYKNILLECN